MYVCRLVVESIRSFLGGCGDANGAGGTVRMRGTVYCAASHVCCP